MSFVQIPSGEFVMGSTVDDLLSEPDERPVRRVVIAQPLWVGRHEVTQSDYERVMNDNPSWFAPRGGGREQLMGVDPRRLPVDMVSWFDAVEFCRRLSDLPEERAAGRAYRLPSEAEWEYACRAGTTTRFAWGDELQATDACVSLPPTPALRTEPVGSRRPNAWGLFDLHGNVWEWCGDTYQRDAYERRRDSTSASVLSSDNSQGTGHVVRGGDWRSPASQARSANRDFTRSTRRDLGNGFRVICAVKLAR